MASPMQRVSEITSASLTDYLTNRKEGRLVAFVETDPTDFSKAPEQIWVNETEDVLKFTTDGGVNVISVATDEQLTRRGVDITEFGAVGDGTTDNAAAIQNAIDFVFNGGGGVVWIPRGNFKFNSTLLLKENVTLQGVGPDVSTLRFEENDSAIKIMGRYCEVKELELYGFESVSGSVGIESAGDTDLSTEFLVVENCRIYRFHKGIYIYSPGTSGGWYNSIKTCDIRGFGSGITGSIGIHLDGFANGNTVTGGVIRAFETAIVTEATVDSAAFIGINDIAVNGVGIHIKGSYNSIVACRFELNGTTGNRVHIKIDGNYNSVFGCLLVGSRSDILIQLGASVNNVNIVHHDPTQVDTQWNAAFTYNGSTGIMTMLRNTDFSGKILSNVGTIALNSYLTLGTVTSLPTASATYRGRIIYVQGNGTSTADIAYICLMSATGTYSWKQIVSG